MAMFSWFGKRNAQRTMFSGSFGNNNYSVDPDSVTIKSYLSKDPVLMSNLRQIVTAIFESQIDITSMVGADVSDDKLQKYRKDLKKVLFNDRMIDGAISLFWNGNALFEVDIVDGKLKGIYNIDPEKMTPVLKPNGDIVEWKHNSEKGEIILPKTRVIHIRLPSNNTDTMAKSYLEPLKYTLARKEVAENYLAGMMQNMSPVVFLKLAGMITKEQRNTMINHLRATKDPIDPFKILGLSIDDEIGVVNAGTTQEFSSVQEYINSLNDEIIRILQVPPIVAGTVDNSNRSNSEIQERAVFGRTVTFFQNIIISQLNLKLLDEKLGWKDVEFTFPLTDEREKETAIVRALKLKELGLSNDAIWKYLNSQGVDIENDFVEPMEAEGVTKDINDMESRRPRDKGGVPQNEAERLKARANGTEVKTNG